MHKYQHKQLIDRILRLDLVPQEQAEFARWIQADAHLAFLVDNSSEDEFVVRAYGPFSLVSTVLVPVELVRSPNFDDLLGWSFSTPDYRACYISMGGRDNIEVEIGFSGTGSDILAKGQNLVFYRNFQGWPEEDRNYFEPLQEFAHLADIHWRSEHGAYCKYNAEGDLDPVLSISVRGQNREDASLVSVDRIVLDQFLAASGLAIVRLFDFTLLKTENFPGWNNGDRHEYVEQDGLAFNRQIIPGIAAYTRGVQVVFPRNGYEHTKATILGGWFGREDRKYAEYISFDWRNSKVRVISTEPSATTNYFVANENELPFELSPAFFKPEVLLKYKADREKYTVETRSIHCRSAWTLNGIDVNEAGQVHAYIKDLRYLPYNEQLHWLSFNEPPKASISSRAFTSDFEGGWTGEIDPLDGVKYRLRQWRDADFSWWVPTSHEVFDNVSNPVTQSRDEWSGAFMDLSHLVVEGFRAKEIKERLGLSNTPFEPNDGSIVLLEKLWNAIFPSSPLRFEALRTIQKIRSKVKGHSGSSEAAALSREALRAYGSYRAHFEHTCRELDNELESIQTMFTENLN
jgi:hypothetical protein